MVDSCFPTPQNDKRSPDPEGKKTPGQTKKTSQAGRQIMPG